MGMGVGGCRLGFGVGVDVGVWVGGCGYVYFHAIGVHTIEYV